MTVNPIRLEVFKYRFSAVAEEMGAALLRTAFSPNIKERRDFSCAVFNRKGEMVAQAAHIPVHLGSMPLSVAAALDAVDFAPGDMVVLNDPFKGGTHLPDITLVAPVFFNSDTPAFYVANRAHHSDVGGMSAGSMPLSRSVFQEGIIIPPIKLVDKGHVVSAVMDLILNNVRTPEERKGDFEAQMMANWVGIERMKELAASVGGREMDAYADHLIDYSETMVRETLSTIPDGEYGFHDLLDDDGMGTTDITITVRIIKKGDRVTVDFRGSHPQVTGSVNSVYAVTLSSVLYVFRCLVDKDIPTNAGCLRPVTVVTEKGSVVDASFPAAVAGGNVETSQRIVDVLLGALAKALPEKIPAASQGTMNNITLGGVDNRNGHPFAYYETMGGGCGAGVDHDGQSATHSHMTNTLNTPIEALEYSYPLRITAYGIRHGSGGRGKRNGGDGMVREIQLLSDAELTILSDRRIHRPYGLNGGGSGLPGRNILITHKGHWTEAAGKCHHELHAGDRIRIETPGGGGYGES